MSCAVKAVDDDGAAIVETFRHETALPEPRLLTDAETGKRTYVWNADADKLELALSKNGRVSATFNYDVVSR